MNLQALMRKEVVQEELSPNRILELWTQSREDIHLDAQGNAWCWGGIIVPGRRGKPDAARIEEWMNRCCWWPNVWESDRGVILYEVIDGELVMKGGMA